MSGLSIQRIWLWLLLLQFPIWYCLLASENILLAAESASDGIFEQRRVSEEIASLNRQEQHTKDLIGARLQSSNQPEQKQPSSTPPEEPLTTINGEQLDVVDDISIPREVGTTPEDLPNETGEQRAQVLDRTADLEAQGEADDIDAITKGTSKQIEEPGEEMEVTKKERQEDKATNKDVEGEHQPQAKDDNPETPQSELKDHKERNEPLHQRDTTASHSKLSLGVNNDPQINSEDHIKQTPHQPALKNTKEVTQSTQKDSISKMQSDHQEITKEKEDKPTTQQQQTAPISDTGISKAESPQEEQDESKSTATAKTKPNLYIHIGPSKTGTSTIQRESSYWPSELEKDHIFYLGKFAVGPWRSRAKIAILFDEDECFLQAAQAYHNSTNPNATFRDTPCWARKIHELDQHRQRGDHIVLSDEAYSYKSFLDKKSSSFWNNLRLGLDGWNVVVVPTYRRYHEWFLSGIKEKNRKGCLRAGKWPHQGGNACHSLWKPIQKMIADEGFSGVNSYTNLDKSISYWKDLGGFDVQILNFHATEHLTCAFYCDLVKNAPSTCEYCRKQRGTNQNPSPAAFTAYDDIVYEAAKRGLFKESVLQDTTRAAMVADLISYHTKSWKRKGLSDLPLVCPPRQSMEALLNKSLAFEQLVMPELYTTPEGEQEHRDAFWKLVDEEKTFCWVDKKTLLEGKQSWKEVLEALKTTEQWPVRFSQK